MPSKSSFPLAHLSQVFGKIYVSSVLKDMIYIIAFFVVAIIILGLFNMDAWWLILALLVFLAFIIVFFVYCYNHLMRTNPDLLRSEGFQLHKLEMMGTKSKELPTNIIEAQPVIEKPRERRVKE